MPETVDINTEFERENILLLLWAFQLVTDDITHKLLTIVTAIC